MLTRRTFFRGLLSIVATIALAPEIAFSRKLSLAEDWKLVPFWIQTSPINRYYSKAYIEWREQLLAVAVDRSFVDSIPDFDPQMIGEQYEG